MRTPVAGSFLPGRAELLEGDKGATASARLPVPLENVVLPAVAQITCGGLLGPRPVGHQQLLGPLADPGQVGDVLNRSTRMDPLQEQHFRAVERADTGRLRWSSRASPIVRPG